MYISGYYIYIYSYVRTKPDIFASYHSGYPWASCLPKPRHLDWNRGHCDDAMSPTEVLAVHMYVSCHASRAANQEINSIHGAGSGREIEQKFWVSTM